MSPASCPTTTTCLTIDKNSEAQEVQVALTATRVPANVWVPFGQEHGAALEATARQVGHHLGVEGVLSLRPDLHYLLPLLIPGAPQSALSLDPSANNYPHCPPSSPPALISYCLSLTLSAPITLISLLFHKLMRFAPAS